MKNALAALAVVLAPVFAPSLAADGTNLAGGDEESLDEKIKTLTDMVTMLTTSVSGLTTKVDALTTNVGHANGSQTGCSATSPCGLLGRVDNLTTDMSNFANRGHQVAIVRMTPNRRTTHPSGRNYTAHYYLHGTSTIPGFPNGSVAFDGKFADTDTHLPAGDYLIEMHQPASDQVRCHGRVFELGCPRFTVFVREGSSHNTRKKFVHGSATFTVTSTAANMPIRPKFWVHFIFPAGQTFTDKSLDSYRGTVKITKLR